MEGRVDPDVIRARLLAVLCATTVCCSVFVGVVWAGHGFRWATLLNALSQTLLLLGFPLPSFSLNLNLKLEEILPH